MEKWLIATFMRYCSHFQRFYASQLETWDRREGLKEKSNWSKPEYPRGGNVSPLDTENLSPFLEPHSFRGPLLAPLPMGWENHWAKGTYPSWAQAFLSWLVPGVPNPIISHLNGFQGLCGIFSKSLLQTMSLTWVGSGDGAVWEKRV